MSDESRRLRTLRQKRLREVGAAGQAKLSSATVSVHHEGLRGEVAVRYLVGAGVGALVAPPSLHALVHALDPGVQVSSLHADVPRERDAPLRGAVDPVEPAARAVLEGSRDALRAIRCVLGLP